MKDRKFTQAHQNYILDLTKGCTHGLTLQTNLHTCNASINSMDKKVEAAHQAMRWFMPRLNRLLTGNGSRRNDKHLPIIITSLEGSLNTYDRNKSLHFHLAIGNFDTNRLTPDFLERLIACWVGTGIGTNDIKLHTLRPTNCDGWGIYINKEAWKGNQNCIDLSNTQLPVDLLAD